MLVIETTVIIQDVSAVCVTAATRGFHKDPYHLGCLLLRGVVPTMATKEITMMDGFCEVHPAPTYTLIIPTAMCTTIIVASDYVELLLSSSANPKS